MVLSSVILKTNQPTKNASTVHHKTHLEKLSKGSEYVKEYAASVAIIHFEYLL